MRLSNKYRPREFEDVVEQKYAVALLKNHVQTKNIKNVYLFLASAGVGKTTLARIFANKLNEEDGAYLEIDAATYNGADDMRLLIEKATHNSISHKYNIILIDEVHALSSAAFQTLLKIFEECPKNTIFLLCTTEHKKVPETIRSRALMINLKKITTNGIHDRLKFIVDHENISISDDILSYISRIANGSIRMAITMLEQLIDLGLKTVDEAKHVLNIGVSESAMSKLLYYSDVGVIEVLMDEICPNCLDSKEFMDSFIKFICDILRYRYTGEQRYTSILDEEVLRRPYSVGKLQGILAFAVSSSLPPNTPVEDLFIYMMQADFWKG